MLVLLMIDNNKNKNKMKNDFCFTEETLNKFDAIFNYVGTLQNGVWIYQNPFTNKTFLVQVGNGKTMFVDGWSPDGMTFQKIVNKLKA